MSCVDSEGMKRDYEKGLTVKEIAEQYLVTEDMVKHAIGLSEGELKKRIKEGIVRAHEMGGNIIYNPDWVLDEAKKEFPVFPKLTYSTMDLTEVMDVDATYRDEVAKWFKKWLGER